MIFESHPWKQNLLKDAEIIGRWKQKKLNSRSEFLLERKIFLNGYSIRKLIEAKKINDDFPYWKTKIERYPKTENKDIDLLNWHEIEKFYDLKKTLKDARDLEFICNLIIHSFIFTFEVDEYEHPCGILVTTYKKKNSLYRITFDTFIMLMRKVGCCDIVSSEWRRNPSIPGGFEIKSEYAFNE